MIFYNFSAVKLDQNNFENHDIGQFSIFIVLVILLGKKNNYEE
ncbi:hypothetical protein [Arenibacter sp. F26102]|nr:hypothetical protein [Arenibacter sp. F26102]